MDLTQPEVEQLVGKLYLVIQAKDKQIAALTEQLARPPIEKPRMTLAQKEDFA